MQQHDIGLHVDPKEAAMQLREIAPHINPADETIRLGPLGVRFLITGDNSNGSVAVFELVVPGAARLAAPAHSHDHYEETIYSIDGVLTWTVDGKQSKLGLGRRYAFPAGPFTGLTTTEPGTRGRFA